MVSAAFVCGRVLGMAKLSLGLGWFSPPSHPLSLPLALGSQRGGVCVSVPYSGGCWVYKHCQAQLCSATWGSAAVLKPLLPAVTLGPCLIPFR